MCSTCGCSEHDHSHMHLVDDQHLPSASPEHPHRHEHSIDHSHLDHSVHYNEQGRETGMPSSPSRVLRLEQDVLAKNALIAAHNRGWFKAREVLALNLMSSPGAGKTTLLERTIRTLHGECSIYVIEGDQETERDATRIAQAGARALQINTGTGCHLDAAMVASAIGKLAPEPRSLVMIENVGNLVCPALFDLGEFARIVLASVTEGEDKPLKYPHMFRQADIMILNKIDLLPHVNFNVDECLGYARRVNHRLQIFPVSATRGDGLEIWYNWLRERIPAGC